MDSARYSKPTSHKTVQQPGLLLGSRSDGFIAWLWVPMMGGGGQPSGFRVSGLGFMIS